MTVYGLFHGGHSYAPPEPDRDLEFFESIAAAKTALRQRHESNMTWRCEHHYADGRIENVVHLTDESAELHLFLTDPRSHGDYQPDRILAIGPRSGIRTTHT